MESKSKIRSCTELIEILDAYLESKNMSRRQFCKLVNIPNSTIASWKSKNVLPSVEVVAKIADYMNVSLDWLVLNRDEEIRYISSSKEYRAFLKFKKLALELFKDEQVK